MRNDWPGWRVHLMVSVAHLQPHLNVPHHPQSSGVIAVATFALWGSATSLWGRFAILQEEKMWFAIWESVTAVANALVFLWAGVASINFLIRSVASGGLGLQESARLG